MILEAGTALDPADRPALLALWEAAWRATMPDIDFAGRLPWFADHVDGLLAGGALLVTARAPDGLVVGFMTVHPASGALDQLAVDPAQAGRGIGRALLAEAKRLSPCGLHLSVNTANSRAVRLYRAAGFVLTGETVNPRSGLPVWTMRWTPGP